jgi:hypothetical protein
LSTASLTGLRGNGALRFFMSLTLISRQLSGQDRPDATKKVLR